MLNPLDMVFAKFSNPATTTFAWVGAEHAEYIFRITSAGQPK